MGFTEPAGSPRPLVVSYTTLSPLPRLRGDVAVFSLWHCPAGRPGWVLPTIVPCGARTFLGDGCPPTRPSGRLIHDQCRSPPTLSAGPATIGTRWPHHDRHGRPASVGGVLILLPPSERKTGPARGRALDVTTLSFPELSEQRRMVATALSTVSASSDAPDLLGVSPGLLDEIAHNLVLASAPTAPAARVYTGVLYDALGYAFLDPASRRRANRWLIVVSALWGAVRPTDRIPPYRLSMDVSLPGVGPLAAAWRPHLGRVLPPLAGRGLIVDARSATYAAAWSPAGPLAERWVHVTVPGASHWAKHTRGLVARSICELGLNPRTPDALAHGLGAAYDVQLSEPTRPGRPWTLAVRTS